jgi:23S rRNA (cytidine1920-2'-O)/16S rRNA (cytidine1409-2'-O)-methyltransferase
MAKTERADVLLVERGLAEDQSHARRLVMAGQVRAGGQVIIKPSRRLSRSVELHVDEGPRFVSRGGEKLAAAFEAFDLDVEGNVCADVGASTGGFTDCLLQHGAEKVYALDVGRGILDWKLRQDPRVVVMEDTNARYVDRLPELVHFVCIDVSFISLKVLLPVVKGWFPPPPTRGEDSGVGRKAGEVVALIKPQFEAKREESARGGGVIRDASIHRRVLFEVLAFAQESGYQIGGLVRSPLLGPKGNQEFLAWLVHPKRSAATSLDELIAKVTSEPSV